MEYVVDPNDPLIKSKDIQGTHLEKGLVLTEQHISDPYTIVDIGLDKSLLTKYSPEQQAEVAQALSEIMKELFNIYYDSPINQVEVINRKDSFVFSPSTTFETALYENSKYIQNIDISKFVGYSLLSTSTLTRYLVESFHDVNYENIIYFTTPTGYLSLIPLYDPNYDEIVERVDRNLSSLIQDGYFGYTFGVHDLDDWELVRELCLLYEIKIINSQDFSTLICQTNVDFHMTPEAWIRYNLPLIRNGEFPTYTFDFDFSFFNDYIRLYGEQFKDIVLRYVAYLAFAKLSDTHHLIRPYIVHTTVNKDLSITTSLPSYALVLQLKEYITKYLNDGISPSDKKLSGVWNLEMCKNLREGILKRWIVQKVDPDAYPMVFKDQGNNEVLIHRSPLAIKYPSRFDFEDLESAEKELEQQMRDYYVSDQVCHDNIEPVTLDKISEMNLEELLNIIPVEEKNKVYCFSDSTIENLVIKENPLTRRPLSQKTLLTQKYLENGLRGLFDVGVLFGLYSSVPTKVNIPIDIGMIKTRREYIDSSRRDLVGNIFLVEVVFEDGTMTPLFEISLPTIELERIDRMRNAVNKLWPEGYFLSDWASAIYEYLDLSSFPIIVTSQVLKHAADSIYDGNVALEMLENAM